jgi:Zn finger protein HypA/HybF involved in hydrogenase expression
MRPKHKRYCIVCGTYLERHEKAFCGRECSHRHKYLKFIERWKSGLETGMRGSQGVSAHIHRYIRETYGNKCIKCDWKEVNPKTGNIPVQLNHKDGNHKNNKEENLELLCPNCHSLTENFMNLNKGNGRKLRYK